MLTAKDSETRTGLTRRALSLFSVFVFFASYCAPQILHAIAHELSHTQHIEVASAPDSQPEFQTSSPQFCEFLAILGTHTTQLAFNKSIELIPSIEVSTELQSVPQSTLVNRLDSFTYRARGPPAIA